MINYNTLGNNLKRDLFKFSEKISKDFTKPTRKFTADMVFGIISAKSCKLTDIGRTLKEDIALKKTEERLCRNLANFSDRETLMNNYLTAVRPNFGDDTMLLIDGGDVTKPSSTKMEAIGTVYDGSEGKYGDGYWTMGAVALTDQMQQPIPVYESLYPCMKQGGSGFKAETKKVLENLRENFDNHIPRIFDRGFDSGSIIKELIDHDEKFILRVNQNRVVVHNGKTTKIDDVVRGLNCRQMLTFRSKTGNVSNCKIGMTKIALPRLGNLKLNLVVCKEFGEKPLVLYTNLDEDIDTLAVRVVKGYLMRWRIEEFYAFKKQSLNSEDFRVRSLESIKTLDLFITIAAGYIGTICEKVNDKIFVSELISVSKRIPKYSVFIQKTKFFYYAVLDGITCLFARLQCGISHYFAPKPASPQLCLPGA